MFRGSVAFMILQSVAGVKHGEFHHHTVPLNLGDDGSRRNGRAKRVAVNDGPLLAGKTGFLVSINETKMRLERKPLHRAAHGQQAGLQNIMQLDFLHRGDSNGPLHLGVSAQEIAQFCPMLGSQNLRIVEMLMRQAVGDDRRCRHDWSGPTTASHFIDSRHHDAASWAQLAFEFPIEGGRAFAPHGMLDKITCHPERRQGFADNSPTSPCCPLVILPYLLSFKFSVKNFVNLENFVIWSSVIFLLPSQLSHRLQHNSRRQYLWQNLRLILLLWRIKQIKRHSIAIVLPQRLRNLRIRMRPIGPE